jgi:transposase-like protein
MSTKCPKCDKAVSKPSKKWKYSIYEVSSYTCSNCKTQFREYSANGKYAFSLKLEKGKYTKV